LETATEIVPVATVVIMLGAAMATTAPMPETAVTMTVVLEITVATMSVMDLIWLLAEVSNFSLNNLPINDHLTERKFH